MPRMPLPVHTGVLLRRRYACKVSCHAKRSGSAQSLALPKGTPWRPGKVRPTNRKNPLNAEDSGMDWSFLLHYFFVFWNSEGLSCVESIYRSTGCNRSSTPTGRFSGD